VRRVRRFHAGVLGVAAGVALALTACPARAGDPREDSRAAFAEGVSEAHQNHFTAARDAFLEAYRLFPHPSILLNLGVTRMRTGEYIAAEENLSRFLKENPEAPEEDVANARAALAASRQHLGTLHIRIGPEAAPFHATLDGAPLTLSAGTFVDVRAVVGPAKLRVEADGYATAVRQVLVDRDAPVSIDIALVPSAGVVAGADGGSSWGSERHAVLGWTLVGAAGLLAVVGAVAGGEAIGFAHDFNTAGNPGYQDAGTKTTGTAWRTSADVLLGTAIVAGGVGAFVLLRPLGTRSDVHVTIGPLSTSVGASF